MGEPRIQLKVNFKHDVKENKDSNSVTKELVKMLNHPDKRVEAVRIANGHRASGIFLELVSREWRVNDVTTRSYDINLMLVTIEDVLRGYYDNVDINENDWYLRPVEGGKTASERGSVSSDEV